MSFYLSLSWWGVSVALTCLVAGQPIAAGAAAVASLRFYTIEDDS